MLSSKKTKRFTVFDFNATYCAYPHTWNILCNLNCSYSQRILLDCIESRQATCFRVYSLNNTCSNKILQFCDFENIEWEPIMRGEQMASSFLIRKGLSRKAQMSLQLKKYFSKNKSKYKQAFPYTIIIETWNAFEEMKIDFSPGVFAAFDSLNFANTPFRQRLEWSLEDARYELTNAERADWIWILKPSVTNKAADICIVKGWDSLIDALEKVPDMREWVLQRYIINPLLLSGHKFHLRVYVLCVGALRVFVFQRMLMLFASHKYNLNDLDDMFSHLTNTACNAQQEDFDELLYVKTLDDLPQMLRNDDLDKFPTLSSAESVVSELRNQINQITSELFSAYENEYTIFAPLSNCFEVYGLDFLVDQDFNAVFLEVNPGPDFKQTGDKLKTVIEALFEQTCELILDRDILTSSRTTGPAVKNECGELALTVGEYATKDFKLVYDKEWSVSRMSGGFSFNT